MNREEIIKLLEDCRLPISLINEGNHNEKELLDRIDEAKKTLSSLSKEEEKAMKVFKFHSGDSFWAYSGQNIGIALNQLFDEVGEMDIDKIREIPESEWDKKTISIWEDNDMSTEPFKVSIREQMSGNYPQQIFTNELS